jgi:hypothetical protein
LSDQRIVLVEVREYVGEPAIEQDVAACGAGAGIGDTGEVVIDLDMRRCRSVKPVRRWRVLDPRVRRADVVSVAADGSLTVNLPNREGSFHPWWSEFRIEAVGFTPQTSQAIVNGHSRALEHTPLGWAATVPDSGKSQTIVLH